MSTFSSFSISALNYVQSDFVGFQGTCLPRHLTHHVFRACEIKVIECSCSDLVNYTTQYYYYMRLNWDFFSVRWLSFSSLARPSGSLEPAADAKPVFPIIMNCLCASLHQVWASHSSSVGLEDISERKLSAFKKQIRFHHQRSSGMSFEEEGFDHHMHDHCASHRHWMW